MTAPRYALYFTPEPGSALARFGWSWLGRAPEDAVMRPLPDLGLEPGRQAAVVADARRYGFHATLKPPFHLAPGRSVGELRAAIIAFAKGWRPFTAPAPVLDDLDGFLALRTRRPVPALHALADACVRHFDRFRAPASAAEKAKRLAAPLSERQRRAVEMWGYPFVFEDYQFHLTLTSRLGETERALWQAAIKSRLGRADAEPMEVRALALFSQSAPDQPFVLVERFALRGEGVWGS
ncbi:MAG: DUF1045 domain-containing protein [Rhodospirillaceae bacterium]|nr:DUF1045 domain-containing protein [Rhodospirillaceae bacterium]